MPNQANVKDAFFLPLGVRDLQKDSNLKSGAVVLDFTGGNTVVNLDMTVPEGALKVSAILGFFIDNSLNTATVQIQMDKSQQSLLIPAGAQALLPILAAAPEKIIFTSAGNVLVTINLLNFRPDPIIWTPASGGGSAAAPLFVRDIFRSNLTLTSVTPGADAVVAASNLSRSMVALQAASTNAASCWININAVASASNFFELLPGATWSMQEPGLVDTRDIHLFGTGGKVTVAVG